MRFKIKNLHDAALKDLHSIGKYKPYETQAKRNKIILSYLFNSTMNGTIKGFYLVSDRDFKAVHRSTKEAGKIQLSSGCFMDGVLLPCYDVQYTNAEEFTTGYKAEMPSGIYKVID